VILSRLASSEKLPSENGRKLAERLYSRNRNPPDGRADFLSRSTNTRVAAIAVDTWLATSTLRAIPPAYGLHRLFAAQLCQEFIMGHRA